MPAMITVKGVVLRETAYGEHDKLFDLFTENGIYTVRARGVRKQGSKYAAVTQVFSYGEFCLRQSGERYFLDSAVPVNLFFGLRGDLEALALAAYFAELLRNTATQQPQPQILRLFLHCLHYLCEHTRPPLQIKAIFELRLATELGHAPNLLCCNLCGEFLPQQLYFRVPSGDFVCKDCRISDAEGGIAASAAVLQAARHIVFSDFERVFLFRLGEHALETLQIYTERNLLTALNLHMPRTLLFYRTLTDAEPPSAPQNAEDILRNRYHPNPNGT